ncbi:hypothetical protein A6A07_22200 [Streptomyces sp. CB03911]|nr:hypothetical protein A6A07_22200 [Streptomyces sp. CB03911]
MSARDDTAARRPGARGPAAPRTGGAVRRAVRRAVRGPVHRAFAEAVGRGGLLRADQRQAAVRGALEGLAGDGPQQAVQHAGGGLRTDQMTHPAVEHRVPAGRQPPLEGGRVADQGRRRRRPLHGGQLPPGAGGRPLPVGGPALGALVRGARSAGARDRRAVRARERR